MTFSLAAPPGCRSLSDGAGGARPTDVPAAALAAAPVSWRCTGTPCPWGPSLNGYALVWPASARAANIRLGYTASAGIYLPANDASGMTISLATGTASVYAGALNVVAHRELAAITPGAPYVVKGAKPGEVVSVLGSDRFSYSTLAPRAPVLATDVRPGDTIDSASASWPCGAPDCAAPDWTGEVIAWASWAAYQGNARAGTNGRLVYGTANRPLYPYMGTWAEGCRVTSRAGKVQVVEWKRGSETWRKTWLAPGESHVIHLQPGEDGALIESEEAGPPFSVAIENCTPKPLPPAPAP